LSRRRLLTKRTLKALQDNQAQPVRPRLKASALKWGESAISYSVKCLGPTSSYKDVRPSLTFLKKSNLPVGALKFNNKSKPSKLRFYLVHLLYVCKTYMPDAYKKLSFNLEALSVNLLLDRVHVYFRKLASVFPSLVEMEEAKSTGVRHTNGSGQPDYRSSALVSDREWQPRRSRTSAEEDLISLGAIRGWF